MEIGHTYALCNCIDNYQQFFINCDLVNDFKNKQTDRIES